jgi:hypothetical protein
MTAFEDQYLLKFIPKDISLAAAALSSSSNGVTTVRVKAEGGVDRDGARSYAGTADAALRVMLIFDGDGELPRALDGWLLWPGHEDLIAASRAEVYPVGL